MAQKRTSEMQVSNERGGVGDDAAIVAALGLGVVFGTASRVMGAAEVTRDAMLNNGTTIRSES